ncbi:unnamed protein product [Orchesella dallaii]|uniref:Uncharacterized protein n=1 Tax=Orchesella dallaii TaxID=48710 RepID=A0ABP1RSH7_9HEXA
MKFSGCSRYFYFFIIFLYPLLTQTFVEIVNHIDQDHYTNIEILGNIEQTINGLENLLGEIDELCHVHIISQSVHFYLDPQHIHTTLTVRQFPSTDQIIQSLNDTWNSWPWSTEPRGETLNINRLKQHHTMKCFYTLLLFAFEELKYSQYARDLNDTNQFELVSNDTYIPYFVAVEELQQFFKALGSNDVKGLDDSSREPATNYIIHISTSTGSEKLGSNNRLQCHQDKRYRNIFTAVIHCGKEEGAQTMLFERESDFNWKFCKSFYFCMYCDQQNKLIEFHHSILSNRTAFHLYSLQRGVTSSWAVIYENNLKLSGTVHWIVEISTPEETEISTYAGVDEMDRVNETSYGEIQIWLPSHMALSISSVLSAFFHFVHFVLSTQKEVENGQRAHIDLKSDILDDYQFKNPFRISTNNTRLVLELAILNLLREESNMTLLMLDKYTSYHWPRIFPQKRLKKDFQFALSTFEQQQYWHLVIVSSDAYNFLTCYNKDSLQIGYYFQPFQRDLWITLLIFFAVLSIVTHIFLIVKECNKSDFNSYFFVYSSMLEHSCHMPDYLYEIETIRIVFGLWLLVSVIFTNAYKGIAITGVTAPPHKSSIQTFSEVIDDNANETNTEPVDFRIMLKIKMDHAHYWEEDRILEDFNDTDSESVIVLNRYVDSFKFENEMKEERSRVAGLFIRETVKLQSLGIDVSSRVLPSSYYFFSKLCTRRRYIAPKREIELEYSLNYDVAVEREIVKCENRVVFVDLKNNIDREYEYLSGYYHHKSFFKGNESLLPDFIVWQFDNDMGAKLPEVFKRLIENGIYKELEWFYKTQEQLGIRLKYTRSRKLEKYEPVKKLGLKSNVQTIFYVLLFGYLVSKMVLGLEAFCDRCFGKRTFVVAFR